MAALVVSAAGCGTGGVGVTRFDDAHVVVRTGVEGIRGRQTVVAEFWPTEDHLHLYGMELPDGGIDGAGRPTRLVVDDLNWRSVGDPTESVASQLVTLAGFDAPFAIYPDGPVTLRQDIEPVVAGSAPGAVGVKVTFMACSSAGVCYVPVEGVSLLVPAD